VGSSRMNQSRYIKGGGQGEQYRPPASPKSQGTRDSIVSHVVWNCGGSDGQCQFVHDREGKKSAKEEIPGNKSPQSVREKNAREVGKKSEGEKEGKPTPRK